MAKKPTRAKYRAEAPPAIQMPLLSGDDLTVPAALRSIRKPVAAIHLVPAAGSGEFTLNMRRVFDALTIVMQLHVKAGGRDLVERIRTQRVSPLFEVRLSVLADLAGIPGKNFVRLYEAVDALRKRDFEWNAVGEQSDVEWRYRASFLSLVARAQERGSRGMIRFAMDPAVLGFLIEPSIWASISLQPLKGMMTPAAYALYQNTARYIGTASKVTAVFPVSTWIELLLGPSGYVEVDGEGNKTVIRYPDFKRRHLIPAIRQVNEHPALSYEVRLKEFTSGKKVVRLQFHMVAKTSQSLGIDQVWPQDVLDGLRALSMSDSEINALGQGHSHEVVAEALTRLPQAEARVRARGQVVANRKSYFHGILANIAAGLELTEAEEARVAAELERQEREAEARQRMQRLQEQFGAHQAATFRRAFTDMSLTERRALGEAYFVAHPDQRESALLKGDPWSDPRAPALAMLRVWMATARPHQLVAMLPEVHDREFDSWLAWRADQPSNSTA